jgi:hypothetical protein
MNLDGTTRAILKQLTELGHEPKVRAEFGRASCEFKTPGETNVASCNDGDGPDEIYRAVCLAAQACGVRLEG